MHYNNHSNFLFLKLNWNSLIIPKNISGTFQMFPFKFMYYLFSRVYWSVPKSTHIQLSVSVYTPNILLRSDQRVQYFFSYLHWQYIILITWVRKDEHSFTLNFTVYNVHFLFKLYNAFINIDTNCPIFLVSLFSNTFEFSYITFIKKNPVHLKAYHEWKTTCLFQVFQQKGMLYYLLWNIMNMNLQWIIHFLNLYLHYWLCLYFIRN